MEDKETSENLWSHPIQIQKYDIQQNNERNKIVTLYIENLEYELSCIKFTKYKNVISKYRYTNRFITYNYVILIIIVHRSI